MNNQRESGEPTLRGFTKIGQQFISNDLIVPPHQIVPPIESVIPIYDLAEFIPPSPFEGGHFDSVAAERQEDALMEKHFSDWFLGKNTGGIPEDVANWVCMRLTGEQREKKGTEVHTAETFSHSQLALEAVVSPQVVFSRTLKENSSSQFAGVNEIQDYYAEWTKPIPKQLQVLIEKSRGNPDSLLLGGGLLPGDKLINAGEMILHILADLHNNYNDDVKLRFMKMLQYPPCAGGPDPHRESVIDYHLNENERRLIENAHGHERRADGLWFTNGSQEALSLLCKATVDQCKATADNPVEIAVTDSTYPGFLMAADYFLKAGTLKLVLIPMDKKGNIDVNALDDALSRKRCKTVYFSEGNPQPTAIANFDEVVKTLKSRERQVVVYEDRAYKGLYENQERSLFEELPEMTVGIQTFSKKFAPGIRVGYMFSGSKRHNLGRDTMLKFQYEYNLGMGGWQTGAINFILEYDKLTAADDPSHKGIFKKHQEDIREYFFRRRNIYKDAYKRALDIAYGTGNYDLDDEVITGVGMFGWRKTPINSYVYADIGAKIGLLSLPGGECIPIQEQIAGNTVIAESLSQQRMRQNFTWIAENRLPLAVTVDVLLQKALGNDEPAEKERAIRELYKLAKELNNYKDIAELQKFIEDLEQNNWQYAP